MSRFDRYLLSQLLALFGFFSLVLVAVYWVNRAVLLFDQLIGEGHSTRVFLEISALTLPNVIRLVLPVSAFAAAVFVTNRLSQDSELVVMQSTGFSPFRLARPVVVFGLIVAVLIGILMNFLVPVSRVMLAEREAALNDNLAARFLHDGRFLHPSDGVTFYIREITASSQLLGVFIMDERNPDERVTYVAQSALLARSDSGPKLLMMDGSVQRLATDGRLSVTRFSDFTYDVSTLQTAESADRREVETVSTPELLFADEEMMRSQRWKPGVVAQELHGRFAQPLLGIAGAMVGFSALLIGAFSRFGLWKQILGAILLLILIQLVATQANALVSKSASAWPALYAAPAVGVMIAFGLLGWAARKRRLPQLAAEGAR